MRNLVEEICDRDDAEKARRQRVGSKCEVVFRSLKKSIQDRVNIYNDRHFEGREAPNAIWIKSDWEGQLGWIKLDKNTEPKGSLLVEFPINSGEMKCRFTFGSEHHTETITLDVLTNGVPEFTLSRGKHTAEEIADALLAKLIDRKTTLVKRPIGFA